MAADGSIVVDVKMDPSQAERGLAKLKKQIEKTEQSIADITNKRDAAEKKGVLDAAVLDAEQAKVEEIRTLSKDKSLSAGQRQGYAAQIPQVRDELTDQRERVSMLKAEYNKTENAVVRYNAQLAAAEEKLAGQKDEAGELVRQIEAQSSASARMGRALDTAGEKMNRLTGHMRRLAAGAFVFSMISAGLRKMREHLGKAIKANAEASAAVARLKGALLTLAQPLINVVLPVLTAFVNVLAKVTAAIAQVVSALFGTTAEESAAAAESLYNQQKGLNGVGAAAKKAGKQLAAFDEINKLSSDSADAAGGAGGGGDIKPDFSTLGQGVLSDLTFNLKDILFKWDDLTSEDILAKIVTGLGALTGGIIGFAIGGPGGAAIGLLLGAGLGLAISNLVLDGDGELDDEEIMSMVLVALGVLAGGVLGFVIGGPGGAAIGILIGAGLSLGIGDLLFNGDGEMSEEEVVSLIIVALGAIVGGVLGFAIGGPGGAALGIILGAGASLGIVKMLFNGDGKMSSEEIASLIVVALGAIVGGVLGFVVGGPGGALIGMIIGTGASISIVDGVFDGDGKIEKSELLSMIAKALLVVTGGIIGFAVGGPGGALIGMAIAAGVLISISDIKFDKHKELMEVARTQGNKLGSNLKNGTKDGLDTIGDTAELWGKRVTKDIANGMEIHSPSAATTEDGRMLGQGLVNGLVEMEPLIQTTVSGLFDKMQEHAEAFLLYLSVTFFKDWSKTWSDCYQKARDNIRDTLSEIDTLNARLAAIERNITVTITTIQQTVSAPGTSGKPASPKATAIAHAARTVETPAVPALARGAVIPPNRAFMAVLGDQKSGNNLELPEGLLRRIVREESGGGQAQPVILECDGIQFAKLIYKLSRAETRRAGVSLAEV